MYVGSTQEIKWEFFWKFYHAGPFQVFWKCLLRGGGFQTVALVTPFLGPSFRRRHEWRLMSLMMNGVASKRGPRTPYGSSGGGTRGDEEHTDAGRYAPLSACRVLHACSSRFKVRRAAGLAPWSNRGANIIFISQGFTARRSHGPLGHVVTVLRSGAPGVSTEDVPSACPRFVADCAEGVGASWTSIIQDGLLPPFSGEGGSYAYATAVWALVVSTSHISFSRTPRTSKHSHARKRSHAKSHSSFCMYQEYILLYAFLNAAMTFCLQCWQRLKYKLD